MFKRLLADFGYRYRDDSAGFIEEFGDVPLEFSAGGMLRYVVYHMDEAYSFME